MSAYNLPHKRRTGTERDVDDRSLCLVDNSNLTRGLHFSQPLGRLRKGASSFGRIVWILVKGLINKELILNSVPPY